MFNGQYAGFGGLIVLILDVWAIVNITQGPGDVAKKVGWTVLVLLFPLGGFIIWALLGPRASKS